jgi:predicted thioesterase
LKEDLKEGLQGEIAIETTNDMAPPHLAEKGNFVYSTPSMVAHMERASLEAISAYLDENETSVGVKVNISHIASTKIGEPVRVTSRVIKVEGRRITFSVEAYNEKEKIGDGTHQRVIIKRKPLQKK